MSDPFYGASALIVSDDSEFARSVAARWQAEPRSPSITVASSDIWQPASSVGYDLVVAGPVRHGKSAAILSALSSSEAPAVVYVVDNEQEVALLESHYSHLPVLVRQDGWLNALILVASEALRRVQAVARAQRAERLASERLQDAALGRYMLDMRPGINDALTSVLGNADLLLADSGRLAPESREQIRAVHTMALRLHQVMQRFSSLAAEMRAGENPSHDETSRVPDRVAAPF